LEASPAFLLNWLCTTDMHNITSLVTG
jgi:hypothetical protein